MEFLQPTSLGEAVTALAEHPGAVAISGGTDVMVELNFDRRRPDYLVDLGRVEELTQWGYDEGRVRLGSAVTYARIISELADVLPGLAMAARTVGSPQIRNRGTVGGNLGAASPAGDSHPVLIASGAEIEAVSPRGSRRIPIDEFYLGVKRNALEPDELVSAVLVDPAPGPQQFCKIGTRNAMVIAVATFALALDPVRKRVGAGIGSAAPTPRRAREAEDALTAGLAEGGLWESRGPLPEQIVTDFGAKVRAAASPIDDVRGTAAYRLHSLEVIAKRSLNWAWNDYQKAA